MIKIILMFLKYFSYVHKAALFEQQYSKIVIL